MNNARFATAIHILTLLAKNSEEWISSEWIAGSISVNPVIVRKELGVLHEHGLVCSRKGKDGGSKLNKPANEITLADIYTAVRKSEILGKKNMNTNPKCPVGRLINEKLEELFIETDTLVNGFLKNRTLDSFVVQF
ncbi:Rrf2 family transcriptional regulator [Bacteroidaceae bacterium HV4-6-C5C]|nr:Rrf2 family transcriptional regulator [Bacteroidaceae bacterium HV4-6-C5C]